MKVSEGAEISIFSKPKEPIFLSRTKCYNLGAGSDVSKKLCMQTQRYLVAKRVSENRCCFIKPPRCSLFWLYEFVFLVFAVHMLVGRIINLICQESDYEYYQPPIYIRL